VNNEFNRQNKYQLNNVVEITSRFEKIRSHPT